MRIILILLIPFLMGLFPANTPELSKAKKGAPLLLDVMTIDAHVKTLTGEFCDHTTNGDFPVEGLTVKLTELNSGTVHEDVSGSNGGFSLTKPMDGPISYEGILPLRYRTDATISDPRFGVNTYDLVLLSQYVNGVRNMCSYTRFGGDINRDGRITQADVDDLRDIVLFITGVVDAPYPHDLWRLVPKLPSVPAYFHPDQQFLADYWNNELPSGEALYPFIAELNLPNDTYVYQNGDCHFVDDVIKEWEYREDVDGCSPNSFDFVLDKVGDFNGSLDGSYLDGTSSNYFGITCSSGGTEGFYEVIPFLGGYVGVGFASSTTAGNGQDVLVIRMNQYGEKIWAKTIGGTGEDRARTVIETSDGNLFITGYSRSISNARADVYILKMDPSGNVLWENAFEGNDQNSAYPGMVAKGIEAADGGFVIGARTENYGQGYLDYYVLKVNALGALQWSKVIGGINNDWPTDIIMTQDNNYLLTGYQSSGAFSLNDMGLLKLDTNGDILWEKHVGTFDNDIATNLTELPNGHILLNGYIGRDGSYNTQESTAVVMEFDADGNYLWGKGYTGNNKRDFTYKTLPTSDGGLISMGRTNSFSNSGLYDAFLMKLDTAGSIEWQKQYGYDENDDVLLTLHEMPNHDYIMGGFTRPPGQEVWDLWYQRTSSRGVIYEHVCFQDSLPHLQEVVIAPQVGNTNLTSIDISEELGITTTSSDYNSDCEKVCELFSGPASLTGGSGAQLRKSQSGSPSLLGKTKRARVSIRTKKPIDGFGFGLSSKTTDFEIKSIRKFAKSLAMDISVNDTPAALANGQVRVLGMVDFKNQAPKADCSQLTPILEIEGVFKNAMSSQQEQVISLAEHLLKTEFIADQQRLTPGEYEVIIDWVN